MVKISLKVSLLLLKNCWKLWVEGLGFEVVVWTWVVEHLKEDIWVVCRPKKRLHSWVAQRMERRNSYLTKLVTLSCHVCNLVFFFYFGLWYNRPLTGLALVCKLAGGHLLDFNGWGLWWFLQIDWQQFCLSE
jgi:hypothetical protein